MWPRAVCVEYGEHDAVTPPGWHRRAWQKLESFAKAWDARELIVRDVFQGNHEIHFVGALEFLDRWLKPERAAVRDYDHLHVDPGPRSEKNPASPARSIRVTHKLDSGKSSRIRGTFHVSSISPVFSGMSFRLSRVGAPGDLLLRFGLTEGGAEIAETRVNSNLVSETDGAWTTAWITPVRLDPGKQYYFELSVEWGWIDQQSYFVAEGPAPLGGQRIPPYFGISFRTLGEKQE